ncbi:MAG: anti-sigma factor family protein [Bryobacteraceae bacterium]
MSCARWEGRVALFAGGDLETAEAVAVERHLSECAACCALVADLRLELDGLREVHAEPLAAAQYAAVRQRVLAELEKPPRRRVAWAWAAALAVAAAAVLLVMMMKPAAIPAPEMPRLVGVAPKVERPVAREPGGNRSLTVAAQRVSGGSRARRPVTVRGSAHIELASLPAIEEEKPAVAEVAPPTQAPPAVEDSRVRMVQLATDDPNVVIYWLFEEQGGER